MDQSLTLDELRDAVRDLTAALIDHHPISEHSWDLAVSTLLAAREQHGGRIRQLIHTILDVGRNPHRPAGELADALTEIHCHLAIADDPPAAPQPARRPSRRQPAISHTQLHLFDPPTNGDDEKPHSPTE